MERKTTVWIFQAIKWLRKRNSKIEAKSFLKAAQNNTIGINYIKVKIDNTQQNNKCGLCGDRDETINQISECRRLVQKEYKTIHNWAGKVIHRERKQKYRYIHGSYQRAEKM